MSSLVVYSCQSFPRLFITLRSLAGKPGREEAEGLVGGVLALRRLSLHQYVVSLSMCMVAIEGPFRFEVSQVFRIAGEPSCFHLI